jgi:hypothetical protein
LHPLESAAFSRRTPKAEIRLTVLDDGELTLARHSVSASCHDEQASFLALNRMHGIVTGGRASRRGITTGMSFELSPHMEQLRLSRVMPGSKLGKLSLGRARRSTK